MKLFIQNSEFSPTKNNLIQELNSVYENISHAGKFKLAYSGFINGEQGVIHNIQNLCSNYVVTSKKAILCDICEGVINQISFTDLSNELKQKIKNKTVPRTDLTYKNLLKLDDYDIDEFDTDYIVNMRDTLPEKETADKKELKQYVIARNNAITYLKQFLKNFDKFETDLINYRVKVITQMMNNIPYLVNEHYKIVYNNITKKEILPSTITVNNITMPFNNKLSDFLKTSVQELILNPTK